MSLFGSAAAAQSGDEGGEVMAIRAFPLEPPPTLTPDEPSPAVVAPEPSAQPTAVQPVAPAASLPSPDAPKAFWPHYLAPVTANPYAAPWSPTSYDWAPAYGYQPAHERPFGGEAPARSGEPNRRHLTLSGSLWMLLLPVVELDLELRLAGAVSITGVFGKGSVPLASDSMSVSDGVGSTAEIELPDRVAGIEWGGQVRIYPAQDFHGFMLGAELMWARLDLEGATVENASFSGFGEGVALGPFVGYKLMTSAGFTALIQGGAQHLWARAEATDRVVTASDSRATWIPLFNLNVGWSL